MKQHDFIRSVENVILTNPILTTDCTTGYVMSGRWVVMQMTWHMVKFITLLLSKMKKQQFLQHINALEPNIHFPGEDSNSDGSSPFYTWTRQHTAHNGLQETYPNRPVRHWQNHHNLSAQFSVFNTLTHRVRTVCAKP